MATELAKKKITEDVFFNIQRASRLLSGIVVGLKTAGFNGINIKDKEYCEKNFFTICLQSKFLNQMAEESFHIYMSAYNNEPNYNGDKLALKYLSLLTLGSLISKMSYLVYDSPNSNLSNFLLKSDLKTSGIIREYTRTNGMREISISWKEYISAIKILTNYFQEKISENNVKDGDKNGNVH